MSSTYQHPSGNTRNVKSQAENQPTTRICGNGLVVALPILLIKMGRRPLCAFGINWWLPNLSGFGGLGRPLGTLSGPDLIPAIRVAVLHFLDSFMLTPTPPTLRHSPPPGLWNGVTSRLNKGTDRAFQASIEDQIDDCSASRLLISTKNHSIAVAQGIQQLIDLPNT